MQLCVCRWLTRQGRRDVRCALVMYLGGRLNRDLMHVLAARVKDGLVRDVRWWGKKELMLTGIGLVQGTQERAILHEHVFVNQLYFVT